MLSDVYNNIAALLGPGVEAWVYGSVAKGDKADQSDLDIYISGPRADVFEAKYFNLSPLVEYNRHVFPAHIIGPATVTKRDFLRCQPEAIRVL